MISLITATYGRVEDVRLLLDSLARQSYHNFELVLVDQNEHNLLELMLKDYANSFNFIYVKSKVHSLSYNRNLGLQYCSGDILGFPDDDCYYDNNVLEEVANILDKYDKLILAATAVKDTRNGLIWMQSKQKYLKRSSTLRYCFSNNIFVRKTNVLFDVRLGVGSFWGSGEESYYLWTIMGKKAKGIFLSEVYIHHPYSTIFNNVQKAYSYGLGFGALFKKEIVLRGHYVYVFLFAYYIIRSLAGCVLTSHKE